MTHLHAPGVIVAGMHRSSTSLVTSALVECGYHIAPDLLTPMPDNPKGYFEDKRMHTLHRRMLEAYDTAWDLSPRLRELRRKQLRIPEHLDESTDELVAYYRDNGPWVWKNPRATLFLEEWSRRFPEATIVVCVRSPAAVVDSMLRRNDRMRISTRRSFYRLRRIFRGLSIWRSYNLMAYRFVRANPDRALVVRLPGDLDVISEACGVVEPGLLRPPGWTVRLTAALALRCHWLHWRLRRRADPPSMRQLLAAARAPQPAADAGRANVGTILQVAASLTVTALLDLSYNVTF